MRVLLSKSSWRTLCVGAGYLNCFGAACSDVTDVVFYPAAADAAAAVAFVPQEFRVRESAREVKLVIEVVTPVAAATVVEYSFSDVEAQATCQFPDFVAASGEVTLEPGQTELSIALLLADDDYAELDEALRLTLTSAGSRETFDVVIEDDERTVVVDATAHGLMLGSTSDQSAALQAALDAAAESGRGVVTIAPGAYVIRSVSLQAGTSIVAPNVVLRSPANIPDGTRLLDVQFAGDEDGPATLVTSTDTVYAVSSRGESGAVNITGSVLGAGVATWFAPECDGCSLE